MKISSVDNIINNPTKMSLSVIEKCFDLIFENINTPNEVTQNKKIHIKLPIAREGIVAMICFKKKGPILPISVRNLGAQSIPTPGVKGLKFMLKGKEKRKTPQE